MSGFSPTAKVTSVVCRENVTVVPAGIGTARVPAMPEKVATSFERITEL
jgi:hypothetical protein